MKTKLTYFCLLLIMIIAGCRNNTTEKTSPQENKEENNIAAQEEDAVEKENKRLVVVFSESKEGLEAYYDLPHIKEFYRWQDMKYTAPPELSYPEDLSTLSYEELRLLRNEVFARNGYLFNDGFLRGYFNKFKWYMPIFDVDTFKVTLTNEEQKLVDLLLKEEAKRKENPMVDRDGLQLYNSDLIVNSKQFSKVPSKVLEDLSENNFSIIDANRALPFYAYDKNAYEFIPHYITTDLYLFILHKYFSCFLEKLDENFLYGELKSILYTTSSKLNEITDPLIQESVEWAKVYNSLALNAIGEKLTISSDKYGAIYQDEVNCINKLEGTPSFIPNDFVSYGELKPRGHYTKSEALENYFKGFKWISLNGIDLNNDEQLKGLILFAHIIKRDEKLLAQYKQYTSVIDRIAGAEDNLSISDIIDIISEGSVTDAVSDNNIRTVRAELNKLDKEKIKRVFGESFQIQERETKRVYFLSSTYSISGEIFSKLVHVDGQNSKRPFPKGLDVPAVFGSDAAENIIIDEYNDGKTWKDYTKRLHALQEQFTDFENWNHNYGFKGLKTALAAGSEDDNYPDYMKTDAYNRKELSTTLSSWTHIKHDLILYSEKPYAAEAGQGGGPPPPQYYGYVEPNLKFWDSALELVDWLEELKKYEVSYSSELGRIRSLGQNLKEIAYKQINGEDISDEEYRDLKYIGGTVEWILLSLLETDHLPEREKSMALVADVYVYNGENLNVAVGHADDIYSIVPIKGEYYIARGFVFSYYEFTGGILNDEEWKSKVKSNDVPDRPLWIKPLINGLDPLEGQTQYRYPGHWMY